MNVAELYLQTAQLGFETTLEDSDRFYFAANRALLQVCKVRPAIRHCLIIHKPLANLIRQDTFSPIEKIEDITYEAEGAKAYYFEATATAFCTSKNTLRTRGNGAFSARFRCNQNRFSCRIRALSKSRARL